MSDGLTPKQQRFVDEYLIDLNATQAAIRAGYAKASARQQGKRLLTNDEIAAAVQAAIAKRAERTSTAADEVLRELARIGLGDVRKLFDDQGRVLPIHEWSDDAAAMVAGIEVVTRTLTVAKDDQHPEVEYVHKFKLWDKNSALDKLMRHLGEYAAEKHEHKLSLEQLVSDSYRPPESD